MPRGVYDRKKSKKSPAVKVAKLRTLVGVPDPAAPPQTLKLDELTLYKIRCLDAEMKSLVQELFIQRNVKEGTIKKLDPNGVLRQLDEKLLALSQAHHAKSQEYEALRNSVGQRLGIDMKKYSYDDATGTLHDIDTPVPGAVQQVLPTEKNQSVQ